MTEQTYTPRPWKVTKLKYCPTPGYAYLIGGEGINTHVALAVMPNDANLIANAPLLLETLKNVLAWMDENPPIKSKKGDMDAVWRTSIFYRERENARRAIQKAQGE